MEFEVPNKSNWKKKHKLVGIGLISTSIILTFVYIYEIVKTEARNSFKR
jgi:hypothetical protein